jgi:hypothetical protein
MKIKAACRSCHQPFLLGRDGLCRACLIPGAPRARLRCQCGKRAKHVILVTVLNPEGAPRTIQLALCRSCLEIERQSEPLITSPRPAGPPNPVQIVVVDRLPQTDNPPKGRKLA